MAAALPNDCEYRLQPDGLTELVLDVGTPVFAERCFAALRELLGIDQMVVFHRAAGGGLSSPLALHAQRADIAQALARLYLRHYHSRDPHRDWLRPEGEARSLRLRLTEARDLRDAEYRARLFGEPGLDAKLALIARSPAGMLYVNLYRSGQAFAAGELDAAASQLTLLARLMERHLALSAERSVPSLGELRGLVATAAARIGATLSPRELETCAHTALGRTAEAIAAELAIGYHSVVTYRKRAFLKLGIAGRADLLPLLLAAGQGAA